MLNEREHDGLVAHLYAAATGEKPWAGAIEALAESFRISACVMAVTDEADRVVSVRSCGSSTGDPAGFYASEVYANDPRFPYFFAAPQGSVYFDHMLYDVDAMFRNKWCRATEDILKVRYQLGSHSRLPQGGKLSVALLSTAREGHASEAAIAAFRRVAPHLQQAASLGQVLEAGATTRTLLLDALAAKADGVVLLDADGALGFMNDAACRMLRDGDGLTFAGGRLATRRAAETRRLRQLVEAALAGSAQGEAAVGHALATRPSGRRPYVISVMAAPRTERFLAGAAIGCVLHIRDLAAEPASSRHAMRKVFGLSDREADLAVELVGGASLDRAAAAAGMARNTARNHLQSIAAKTGARGQTRIVQLLSRLP